MGVLITVFSYTILSSNKDYLFMKHDSLCGRESILGKLAVTQMVMKIL